MEALNIPSRMARFCLIGRLSAVSPKEICAVVHFDGAPAYTGLEAMAQVAALHVRRILDFERHAFLLRVYDWQLPFAHCLTGEFRIRAGLRSHSSSAFRYEVAALGADRLDLNSSLLIGTRDYGDRFSEDILKVHYQGLWAALKA
jgi:hypothetical protein